MSKQQIGEKIPIGNTDCPVCYGLYPLADLASRSIPHSYQVGNNCDERFVYPDLQHRLSKQSLGGLNHLHENDRGRIALW